MLTFVQILPLEQRKKIHQCLACFAANVHQDTDKDAATFLIFHGNIRVKSSDVGR